MAKKLKVFHASIGFFELAVAAPSMKAAAEAWGSNQDIFKNGLAKETEDAGIVEAALASPGVVLRRAIGSDDAFKEKAALPKIPADERVPSRESPATKQSKSDAGDERREAEALARKKKEDEERERKRREREKAIAKAKAEFETAEVRHAETMNALAQRQDELDTDVAREEDRWTELQRKHEEDLRALEDND